MIFKFLVNVKFANIINIINNKEVIPELLQSECNANEIFKSVNYLLKKPELIRKLKEKSITLDELGQMLKISKERVRQIETKALEKLKTAILEISQQNKEFFIW